MSIFAIQFFFLQKYVNATQQNKIRKSKVCCVFFIQFKTIALLRNGEIMNGLDAWMIFKTYIQIGTYIHT